MHAAHERIVFNKLRESRKSDAPLVQLLLLPQLIKLNEEQLARIHEYRELLEQVGFLFNDLEQGIEVTQVPSIFQANDLNEIFMQLCELPEHAQADGVFVENIDHILARKACHASVRSGRTLEKEEAYALLHQMEKEDLANACPHGRPVIVSFSRAAVEQWFGRDR